MSVRTGLLVLSGLLAGFLGMHLWRTHGRPPVQVSPTPAIALDASANDEEGNAVRSVATPSVAITPAPEALPSAQGNASSTPAQQDASTTLPASRVAAAGVGPRLTVPVQGIAPAALSDTFDDARGNERRHEALDIMAPAGTPVLAAADGHIEKLFDSKQGGLTIYQFEPSGRHAYYYAHLERYAPGLAEKQAVKRGELIGYVGSTGNADPAAPHLHFAVFVLGPEKQWWKGTAINPYPLLRAD